MKKYIFLLLTLALLVPTVAFGQQVLFPNRGGTGTSTIPTLGQVLSGFSDGTYGPVATSTLGFISLSDLATQLLNYVTLSTDQTISGVKNFSVPPTSSQSATQSNELVRLDQLTSNLIYKSPVVAATTTDITLSGTQVIDGYTASNGDRIGIYGQTASSTNGCYTMAAGAWSRCTDYDSDSEVVQGTAFFTINGTSNMSKTYSLSTPNPITVGTTGLLFVLSGTASEYTGSQGVQKVGNDFRLNLGTNGGLSLFGLNTLWVNHDNSTLSTSTGRLAVATGGITGTQLGTGSVVLSSTDVTGTLPIARGGTNNTTATDDSLLVGNGTTLQLKALSDCDTSSSALTYDISANNFGCNSITGGSSNTSGASNAFDLRYTKTLDVSSSTVSVTNTAAATTIYSYSVPANTLGTDKGLRLNISGQYLNNSGANRTVTITVSYGGTTMISQATPNIATSGTTGNWGINVYLMAANATNAQRARLDGSFEAGTAADVVINDNGTASVDSTANQTLTVTVANSAAATTITTTKNLAVLEQLNAQQNIGGSNWVASTTYNTSVITPTTTIGIWSKGSLFASSTSIFSDLASFLNGIAVTNATSTFDGISINNTKGLTFQGYSAIPQILFADGQTGIHSDGPGIISFHNSGSQSALINGSGNFGIATSAPAFKLSVDGTVAFQGTNFATTTIGSKNAFLKVIDGIFDGSTFPDINVPLLVGETIDSSIGALKSVGINNELIIFEDRTLNGAPTLSFGAADFGDTGNSASISYSTSTPALKVNTDWVIENTNDTPTLQFNTTGGATTSKIFATADDSMFFTNASGGYFFDNSIAVLSDDDTGSLVFSNSLGSIISAISFATSTDQMQFVQASGGYYFTGGNVGIATTTPWRTLSVTGTVGMDGLTLNTGTAAASLCLSSNNEVTRNTDNETCLASSARYKENIEALGSGLEDLLKLKPVEFSYKNSKERHLGFIAEDVEKVDTKFVSYDDQGLANGIRWSHITTLAVKSIQKLSAKVDGIVAIITSHESRIRQLERENELLKARLEALENK